MNMKKALMTALRLSKNYGTLPTAKPVFPPEKIADSGPLPLASRPSGEIERLSIMELRSEGYPVRISWMIVKDRPFSGSLTPAPVADKQGRVQVFLSREKAEAALVKLNKEGYI